MSEKCKTLMMPSLATSSCWNDGIAVEAFLAAAPSPIDMAKQELCDGYDTVDGVAGAVGGAQQIFWLARRLAAIAFVEVVAGPHDILTCRRAMTSAWTNVMDAILRPGVAPRGGRMLRQMTATATFEFASILLAVQWAGEVQSVCETPGDEMRSQGLRLRISIGVGEVNDAIDPRQGSGLDTLGLNSCLGRAGEILITGRALAVVEADLEGTVVRIERMGCDTQSGQDGLLYSVNRHS